MRIPCTAVLAVLLAASPAGAKGIGTVEACDRLGCRTLTAHDAHHVVGARFADGPDGPVRAVVLRVTPEVPDAYRPAAPFAMHFDRASGMLRGADGRWMRPDRSAARALRRATHGISADEVVAGDGSPWPLVRPRHGAGDASGAAPAAQAAGAAGALVLVLGLTAAVARRRRRAPPGA